MSGWPRDPDEDPRIGQAEDVANGHAIDPEDHRDMQDRYERWIGGDRG